MEGHRAAEALTGKRVEIITDRTPFYGESGRSGRGSRNHEHNGNEILVEETAKPVPESDRTPRRVTSGSVREGDKVHLAVNSDRDSPQWPIIPRPMCSSGHSGKYSAITCNRVARWWKPASAI